MAYVTCNGTVTYNRAKYKPHDKHIVRIAKVTHNAAALKVPANSIVNMIDIPANSIVLGAWGMISTDSNLANAEVNLGYAGGSEYGVDVETDGTAGTVSAAECTDNVHWVKAANQITMTPNDAELNAGAYMVMAAWIELDSLTAST